LYFCIGFFTFYELFAFIAEFSGLSPNSIYSV